MGRYQKTKKRKAKKLTRPARPVLPTKPSDAIAEFLTRLPHSESEAETTKEIMVKLGITETTANKAINQLFAEGKMLATKKLVRYRNGVLHPTDAYYVVDG